MGRMEWAEGQLSENQGNRLIYIILSTEHRPSSVGNLLASYLYSSYAMSIIERDHGNNPSILFLHSTIVHHTIHSRNGRTPNIVGQDINNSANTLKSYSTIHITKFITRSALISPSEANSSRNASKRPIFSTTPERITNHEFSKLGPPSRFSPCSVPIRVFKKTDDHPAILP